MESPNKSLNDLAEVLRRRKWSLIVPGALVCVIMTAVALLLPPVYRSSSTILIEDQEIPRDYVVTTVTSFAEQRLQTINQRIMSASRLLEIIKANDLYPEYRGKWTSEELVERLRRDISFETISSDVIDPRTGRSSAATIAFSLSFQGSDPKMAQKVANVLASLYLEENLKVREKQTEGASRFLEEETNAVKAELEDVDARLAVYKEQYVHKLPELYEFNLQALERTERDIDHLRAQLQALQERESYLQTQLDSLPTEEEDADRTRLNELRLQLGNLLSRVSEQYPDVLRLRSEISALEARLAAADQQPGPAENPAYVSLAAQLAGVRAEIDAVRRQAKDTDGKREDFRRRIEATPRVEEGYKALLAERNNLQVKYDDLTRKFMESRVARGLEKDQMGERFTLIEAAMLPEKPVSPNRPAIVLVGLILGLAVGIGVVSLREAGDRSVRTVGALARSVRHPVLVSIPEILTPQDLTRAHSRRRMFQAGIVVTLVAGAILFHFVVMDFDVFWAKVLRRLAI